MADLCFKVAAAQQIVSRLDGQDRDVFIREEISHAAHVQIIGDDHAVKPQRITQERVDRDGQGSRAFLVHAGYDVVGDQDHGRPAFDAAAKGQQIGFCDGITGTSVDGDAGVCIGIVALAGEVLQYAAHLVLFHHLDDIGHIGAGHSGILTEAARVDEVVGIL